MICWGLERLFLELQNLLFLDFVLSAFEDLIIRYVLPCSVFSSSIFVPPTLPLTNSNLILSIQILFC